MIREAKISDKKFVLKFCKNTFSWGDYIDQVWDFWISEGNLFLFEKQIPVGICHAFYSHDQVWIEGIRVDPNFRKQKIASKLVNHAESIGKQRKMLYSYMLIDTENNSSLSMANSLSYNVFQTWNFFSLLPKKKTNFKIIFEKSLNNNIYTHYVKSWRWLPIDKLTLSQFYKNNRIVKSVINEKESVAILVDSEHFKKTLVVTIFSGSNENTVELLNFLQNFGIEKNYERIQILSKEMLPTFDSLEHKISFHLMKKSLV